MVQNLILISKWWKNHSTTITFSKSYLLHISFQLLCTNFSGCTRITNCAQCLKIVLPMTFSITVHSYFVFVYKRNLSEYFLSEYLPWNKWKIYLFPNFLNLLKCYADAQRFLILGAKTTNKNMVKSKKNVLI